MLHLHLQMTTSVSQIFFLLLLESDPPSPIPCRHRYNFRSTSPSVNSTYWRHPFEDSYSWRKEAMHIIWRNNTCCEDILNVNWELLGQCQIDFIQHLVTCNFLTICGRKMNDTIFHIISYVFNHIKNLLSASQNDLGFLAGGSLYSSYQHFWSSW